MRFLMLMIVLVMAMPSAFAAEDKKKVAVETAPQKTPVSEWIESENKLIDTLSQKDKEAFYVMRNKHGILRSVRVVNRDVGAAVKTCGKENPTIKDKMNARYKDWQGAILPILDTAEKFLNEEIDTQKVVVPSDFKYILKLNDEAFAYGEKQIRKEPVTTLDACQGLVDSMDRTENELINLLETALLPESVIRQKIERAEEAEKKSKQ